MWLITTYADLNLRWDLQYHSVYHHDKNGIFWYLNIKNCLLKKPIPLLVDFQCLADYAHYITVSKVKISQTFVAFSGYMNFKASQTEKNEHEITKCWIQTATLLLQFWIHILACRIYVYNHFWGRKKKRNALNLS